MRKHRFFTERTNLRAGSSVKLPNSEAKHAKKYLRLGKGSEIFVFNGEKEYRAILKIAANDLLMAEILEEIDFAKDSNIHLFQSLTKPKSFELVLEKTTELGVSSITPIEAEYSVISSDKVAKRFDRWRKIILSACKRSERITIPVLNNAMDFSDAGQSSIDQFDRKIVLHYEQGASGIKHLSINDLEISSEESVAIFVGPEGGFSENELEILHKNKFSFLQISDYVLRSETAAILGVGLIKLKVKS